MKSETLKKAMAQIKDKEELDKVIIPFAPNATYAQRRAYKRHWPAFMKWAIEAKMKMKPQDFEDALIDSFNILQARLGLPVIPAYKCYEALRQLKNWGVHNENVH